MSSSIDALPFPPAALQVTAEGGWRPWRVAPDRPADEPVSLAAFDPAAKPLSRGSKSRDQAAVESIAEELDGLQNLFFADRRFRLLLVLQGTDTSGKDGTVRGVFSRTSPLGVHTVGWQAPTQPEKDRDFLWRIHQKVPGAGEIMVFNRSHYEDVLVPVVNGWISPDQTRQRLAQINDFERMLAQNGTVIVKCLLHIGKDEQRERLQARIDDPAKHWKFSLGDVEARQQWDDYQRAYDQLLKATSTPWAPWTVIPANSKTHRNLMVGSLVRDTLQRLGLRYPPENPALKGLRIS
ncbi:MAG: polyphosphate--nucleotide phosphotransferase [Hydrogenophaga sp.]|nr:polyphosphate--nucleotide phosphotransferase [Hydrogenophaga sp.]